VNSTVKPTFQCLAACSLFLKQNLKEFSQAAKTLDLSNFFPVVPIISQAPYPKDGLF
jgi:hypothetical protein